jgi:hypothetical protein
MVAEAGIGFATSTPELGPVVILAKAAVSVGSQEGGGVGRGVNECLCIDGWTIEAFSPVAAV